MFLHVYCAYNFNFPLRFLTIYTILKGELLSVNIIGEGQRQLTSKVQGQMHHNGCLVSINGNAWRVEQILFFV